MEPLTLGLIGVLAFCILLLLGIHVAIAMGIVGVSGMILIIGLEPTINLLATTVLEYGTMYSLIVVPLFITMGLFATETGITRDLYNIISIWFGRIKGALAISTIGACTIFGAMTGSSIATAIVFAKVSAPEMIRHGYNKQLSYALCAASGALGMMIPPSILAVIYGVLVEESIGKVLIGGIGPGLTLAICLSLGVVLLLYARPSLGPPTEGIRAGWKEKFVSMPKLWPIFIIIIIVIGGIYTGVFTVTEAAGIANFVLLALYFSFNRFSKKSLNTMAIIFKESISLTAMIFSIFCLAQIFSRFMVLSGISDAFTKLVISSNLSPLVFVIATGVLYLILGCLIDSISILMLTVPLLLPIVKTLDIDLIWFGVIMILNTQIGLITPPVGINIYVVKGIAGPDVDLVSLFRAAFPLFIFEVVALAICVIIPPITTWLPYTMMGK
jgi:tripartite ATP-independent transporter DctM subunit